MNARASAVARTFVVAELQARDLLHRRAVMALFVLLPAAFYYSVPANEDYSLVAGSMGVSWAVAAAGLFGILGWQRTDPRLALAGAPVYQGLLGRLLVLVTLCTALLALFVPQILWRSAALIQDATLAVLALALLALVSVPLGLAIGALVPRELEGTLVLIGIVGVGMSVMPDSTVGRWLPLSGPLEILMMSAGLTGVEPGPSVGRSLAAATVLLVLAYVSWRRRFRLQR